MKNEFTTEEKHALVCGLCEVVCPWPPRIKPTKLDYVQGEYHYYQVGRALGVIAWLIIIVIMKVLYEL